MTFLEPLTTQGSFVGVFLLLYATCVSALCSSKARNEPFNLSLVERSPLSSLVAIASIPGAIWVLVYVIGYLGLVKGFLVWFVTGILTTIVIQVTGFGAISGLHLILSAIAIIAGSILTIRTHPF